MPRLAVGLHALLLGLRVYDPDLHGGTWMGRSSPANLILMLVFVTFLALYLPLYLLVRRVFPTVVEKIDPDTATVPALLAWLGLGAA